jgi:hypothetical protein
VVRYAFIVRDLHPLLLAGLPALRTMSPLSSPTADSGAEIAIRRWGPTTGIRRSASQQAHRYLGDYHPSLSVTVRGKVPSQYESEMTRPRYPGRADMLCPTAIGRSGAKSCFVHCSEDEPIQKAGAWRTALSIALRSSSARGSTGNLKRMPYQFHRLLDRERVSGPRKTLGEVKQNRCAAPASQDRSSSKSRAMPLSP